MSKKQSDGKLQKDVTAGEQTKAEKAHTKPETPSASTSKVKDPRAPVDFVEVMTRKMDNQQNDMGIENALNLKDLEMSLNYVLDQVAALENMLAATINYFVKMRKGTLTNEKLNKF